MDVQEGRGSVFGELLRARRTAAGLTQEELAGRCGLSVRAVADLERGRTARPYRRSVTLLADALGLSGQDGALFARTARPAIGAGQGRPGSPGLAAPAGQTPAAQTPATQTAAQAPTVVPVPVPVPVPVVPVVPRQLPAAVRHFVGRSAELADLAGLADQAGGRLQTVVISAIAGTAGVARPRWRCTGVTRSRACSRTGSCM